MQGQGIRREEAINLLPAHASGCLGICIQAPLAPGKQERRE
jgi:hypothetical protein